MPAYATGGRILSGLLALGMPIIAVWQLMQPEPAFVLCLYVGGMGALVALIELPLLCSCSRWCVLLGTYTRLLAGLWLTRAIIYILIAAGGFAIYQLKIPAPPSLSGDQTPPASQENTFLLIPLIVLVLAAALYLMATVKKEANPYQAAAAAAPAAAAGGSGRKSASAPASSSRQSHG